jgi:glycosyltransferase involved in cell wall biosynthesis
MLRRTLTPSWPLTHDRSAGFTMDRAATDALQGRRDRKEGGVPRVSAIVICLNEERKIGRCLASLGWVDELVVVDGGSTDRTVSIARSLGATVHTNPWPGFAAQKTFALAQATGDWVVSLDADEELEPGLAHQIQTTLAGCPPDVDGLVMPRKTRYLGRWITHGEWYPDEKLRVFRRTRGACTNDEVHERFTVPGRTLRLSGHILHYSHDDVAHHVRKADLYAGLVAATRRRAGARFSPGRLLSDPIRRAVRGYVWRRGFLDGTQGLIISALTALYVFLIHAKLFELELSQDTRPAPLES